MPPKSGEIHIGQRQDRIAFWEEPFEMNLEGSVVESKQTEIREAARDTGVAWLAGVCSRLKCGIGGERAGEDEVGEVSWGPEGLGRLWTLPRTQKGF